MGTGRRKPQSQEARPGAAAVNVRQKCRQWSAVRRAAGGVIFLSCKNDRASRLASRFTRRLQARAEADKRKHRASGALRIYD